MADEGAVGAAKARKRRVLKAPAVRRAELVDCAQRLFLEKGYERTTINDVIAATGLSKGAFYHHFRAKEDLLEAIAERTAAQVLSQARGVLEDRSLDALQRFNALMATGREWKAAAMPQLRAMFMTLFAPENLALYHRIVQAMFQALGPVLTGIVEDGVASGVMDTPDPAIAVEAILKVAEGRRALIVEAMATAEAGDAARAVRLIMDRVRAEEGLIDRILGVARGSVQLIGSEAEARALTEAWVGELR
ncbi:MAG TPA: TetR/AcrR family transcriptional regulator [Caulobacteraceae bacterium]|nr:TetR/AcrR family transcriptional regulator [Caulobacteraceae bacterium]